MPAYHPRPGTIQAVQFLGPDNAGLCFATEPPNWLTRTIGLAPPGPGVLHVAGGQLYLGVEGGAVLVRPGDWLAFIAGAVCVCPAELFAVIFEEGA